MEGITDIQAIILGGAFFFIVFVAMIVSLVGWLNDMSKRRSARGRKR